MCYCILDDMNNYQISIESLTLEHLPDSKDEKVLEIMNRISKDLENKIKQYPQQYFWFHKKWSKKMYKV